MATLILLAIAGLILWGAAKTALWALGEDAERKTEKAVVTEVIDGDSLIVKTREGKTLEVRLEGIDAPEVGQAGGEGAKDLMEALVEGEAITLSTAEPEPEKDIYGRTLAKIGHQNEDLGEEMVERGGAWAVDENLEDEQDRAKNQGKGIWKNREWSKTPPWEFRKTKGPKTPQTGPTLDDFR